MNFFCTACGKDYVSQSRLNTHCVTRLHKINEFWQNIIFSTTGNMDIRDRCIFYILVLSYYSLPFDIINIIVNLASININGWYVKETNRIHTSLYEIFYQDRFSKSGYMFNIDNLLPIDFVSNIRQSYSEQFEELYPKYKEPPKHKRGKKVVESKKVLLMFNVLTNAEHLALIDDVVVNNRETYDKIRNIENTDRSCVPMHGWNYIFINHILNQSLCIDNTPINNPLKINCQDQEIDVANKSGVEKTNEKNIIVEVKNQRITKKRREEVWDRWIGESVGVSLCMLCNKIEMKQGGCNQWDCGHVISRCNGGKVSIENLRPICKGCNASMGKNNMDDYCKVYEPNSPVLKTLNY